MKFLQKVESMSARTNSLIFQTDAKKRLGPLQSRYYYPKWKCGSHVSFTVRRQQQWLARKPFIPEKLHNAGEQVTARTYSSSRLRP